MASSTFFASIILTPPFILFAVIKYHLVTAKRLFLSEVHGVIQFFVSLIISSRYYVM